ncbi:MAG: phosphoribosylformylglycinamidine synthase [Flavobacteriales bacterium]|nr:phosphoribosylformylglycinamidine synthase [Flavobacteriales bacterium]
MNHRIYIQKKKEFDVESSRILNELKDIVAIESIKMYSIYDVFNLSDEELNKCLTTVFVDPVADKVVDAEEIQKLNNILAVESLPGQYNQRADSAEQAVSLILGTKNHKITTGILYSFEGINANDLPKIENYLINSVETQKKDLSKLEIPKTEEASDVPVIANFINWNESELNDYYSENSFAFGFDDLAFIQDYFKNEEHRNPTETELKVLDTYWSDHCRHTTFLTELENIKFTGDFASTLQQIFDSYLQARKELKREQKPITLMDLATVTARYFKKTGKLDNMVVSDEINACTIEVDVDIDGKKEPWYFLFKNETHNHPTEIEPFGGASTCIGGAIRDPLSGRSFVYQAMRVTGAGNILEEVKDTMEGKLPQRKISKEAAHGYSSYGNQIGLATTHVAEIYDEGYKAKRMEVGFVAGAVPKEYVRRENPKKGDKIVVLGGKTGRDGVGGATGSSKSHDEKSIHTLSSEVQKGDAVQERKIQRLFRKKEVTQLIKKSNDFGAGGVSVAIGELADGLTVNLDVLPTKYAGLNGTELAISESQERMAVVLDAKDVEQFIELAKQENILAVEVAEVTDNNRLEINWKGTKIVNLSREFLDSNGVQKSNEVEVISTDFDWNTDKKLTKESFKEELAKLNIASQKGLVEMFDSTVGRTTVLMPFGGKYQLSPAEGSVQAFPVLKGKTSTCSLATWGFDVSLSNKSCLHSGAYAVVESVAKIVALGGNYKNIRLTFQEYFEKLGTDKQKWGKPLASILGSVDAQFNFEIAAIGGKDSMSGTFKELNVPPTLISFAVATENIDSIISSEFKQSGKNIYLFKHSVQEDKMPNYNQLKSAYDLVYELNKDKKINSVKTIKEGGIAVALAKMSFGNGIGAEICTSENIFDYTIGSLLVVSNEEIHDANFQLIGKTIDKPELIINSDKFDLNDLLESWTGTFEKIYPTDFKEKITTFESDINKKNVFVSNVNTKKVPVAIPIFPGTNCEYETVQAFENEGGKVNSFLFNNLNESTTAESIQVFKNALESSKILMFPGGFSAGDEPDGSAKFIVSVLKNPIIKDAIHEFLANDGLILGICNGFQALIKSGLVTYGEIRDLDESAPTLTFNKIGRHISQMVDVKVVNENSPWLKGMKDEVYTIPVSHGEGRFYADDVTLNKLIENKQIATQYIDANQNIALEMPFNPNASVFGVEGITSKDGKIYGRMGHPERFRQGLMKNIPNSNYHNIFKNGIEYFG